MNSTRIHLSTFDLNRRQFSKHLELPLDFQALHSYFLLCPQSAT